jgi:hypothetical protein
VQLEKAGPPVFDNRETGRAVLGVVAHRQHYACGFASAEPFNTTICLYERQSPNSAQIKSKRIISDMKRL